MRVEAQGPTPIKLWTTSPQGDVPVEDKALAQLRNIASLPFVFRHVAAMPDVHLGMGATDLARQTEGVECRKDQGVLYEIPGAEDLDLVMAAQGPRRGRAHPARGDDGRGRPGARRAGAASPGSPGPRRQ